MSAHVRTSAIEELHPLVPAIYFAGALGFAMAAFQPVYLGMSLLFGLALCVYLRGWPSVAKSLGWQLPLVLLLVVVNPLVGSQGRTVLFEIFGRTVALEKLLYGVCMGELLLASLAWFSAASRVMSVEKVTALTGGVAPVVGTTLSMATRLVPLFMRRAACVNEAVQANTAAYGANRAPVGDDSQSGRPARRFARMKASVEEVSRRVSVLMGWGMEDSLTTADSMLCRGWGARTRHTTYRRYRFTVVDGVALAVVLALFAAALVGCIRVAGPFQFYPVMGPWAGGAWWAYVVFALYLALPLLFEEGAKLVWRS